MASHDNYDKDVLKALQRIANSLEKIEKKMPVKPIKTMNELRESSGLSKVDDNSVLIKNPYTGEILSRK